jgi:hypothetical protein
VPRIVGIITEKTMNNKIAKRIKTLAKEYTDNAEDGKRLYTRLKREYSRSDRPKHWGTR